MAIKMVALLHNIPSHVRIKPLNSRKAFGHAIWHLVREYIRIAGGAGDVGILGMYFQVVCGFWQTAFFLVLREYAGISVDAMGNR